MGRQIRALTVTTLDDLPAGCRTCVFWELGAAARVDVDHLDPDFEKEAWCSEVGLTDGACGAVAYLDGRPAGYALYGRPELFAAAESFPARVSPDALLLATMHVVDEEQRGGVGRALVHEALKDTKERGKKALEAFADREWVAPACLVPYSFLDVMGFRVRRDHPRYPLMRMDVRSLASLQESMEAAVERLLRGVRRAGAPAPRPAR